MEIFYEVKTPVKKILENGVPTSVSFDGQFVFTQMTKIEQEIFKFKENKGIIYYKGNVAYSNNKDDMERAIRARMNRIISSYENQTKIQTAENVEIASFNKELSKLKEIKE